MPFDMCPDPNMATLTGHDALAALKEAIESHAEHRGAVTFVCSGPCMNGKLCHRSLLIAPARMMLQEHLHYRAIEQEQCRINEQRSMAPTGWVWQPLECQRSEAQARAAAVIIVSGILWSGLNQTQVEELLRSGTFRPKGVRRQEPSQSVRASSRDDCYLHASLDRLQAFRYAHGTGGGRGGGFCVMLDVAAIAATFGRDAVIAAATTTERRAAGITEGSVEDKYAKRDF